MRDHTDCSGHDPTHTGNVQPIEDNWWRTPYFLCYGGYSLDR